MLETIGLVTAAFGSLPQKQQLVSDTFFFFKAYILSNWYYLLRGVSDLFRPISSV